MGIDNARTALHVMGFGFRALALWETACVMVVHRFMLLNLKL